MPFWVSNLNYWVFAEGLPGSKDMLVHSCQRTAVLYGRVLNNNKNCYGVAGFKVLKMMKRVRVAISLIGLYKDDDLQEANYHMVQLAMKYPNK